MSRADELKRWRIEMAERIWVQQYDDDFGDVSGTWSAKQIAADDREYVRASALKEEILALQVWHDHHRAALLAIEDVLGLIEDTPNG